MAPPFTTVVGALVPQLGLTNSAVTQVHIQGLELAYPNIYPISDMLECVKGLVQQGHGRMVYRLGATVALNLNNSTLYNEVLQGKLDKRVN